MLKLKFQYLGSDVTNWKDPNVVKHWAQEEEGTMEDEMAGWHHRLNGYESEQTAGASEEQGSLAFCSPWGLKELDMTEWWNNKNKYCLPLVTTIPLSVSMDSNTS